MRGLLTQSYHSVLTNLKEQNMRCLLLTIFITFSFAITGFAQLWDYVLTGDVLPTKFDHYLGFDDYKEWSFADSAGARMNLVFTIANDPDDSTNKVLQCIDLYNLGENNKMAIMTGDRFPIEQAYEKVTFLFRARCIKPEEVPDSLATDAVKARRWFGWNVWLGGRQFQILFETGEDSPDAYPNWMRVARVWSDSAKTRNDTVNRFAWNTFRILAEVDHVQQGIAVKAYLNENPEPVLQGLYTETYNQSGQTAFFFGDDRTSGWQINENGVMNGGAKGWFDWVAIAWDELLEPGTPLPLGVKVDGPDGNPVKNEGWVWAFDGSKNLVEGATNSYARIAIDNQFPGFEASPKTYNNAFLYYYQDPLAIKLLWNSMCYHIEDPNNPGNMLLEWIDDNEFNPVDFEIGPYARGEYAADKGTILFRARNLTEDEAVRSRTGWAATVNVPGFSFGDIKAVTGYYSDHGLRPCGIEFFNQATNPTGRFAYTVDESGNFIPNTWLSAIGGTFNAFDWHTYRMTWDRSLPDSLCCKLYVDENPIVALENQPWPATVDPQEFGFIFGDQRTNNTSYDASGASDGKCAAWYDYVAVNFGNAYGPGQGDVPEGFIVDVFTNVEKQPAPVAESFALIQNYPNPFNPTTTIEFTIDRMTKVELYVYDLLGQKVKTLINSRLNSGVHFAKWDGTNESGAKVTSGIYLYTLKTGDGKSLTKKMLFIK